MGIISGLIFFKEFKKTLLINLSVSNPLPLTCFNCFISSSVNVFAFEVCFFLHLTKSSRGFFSFLLANSCESPDFFFNLS